MSQLSNNKISKHGNFFYVVANRINYFQFFLLTETYIWYNSLSQLQTKIKIDLYNFLCLGSIYLSIYGTDIILKYFYIRICWKNHAYFYYNNINTY